MCVAPLPPVFLTEKSCRSDHVSIYVKRSVFRQHSWDMIQSAAQTPLRLPLVLSAQPSCLPSRPQHPLFFPLLTCCCFSWDTLPLPLLFSFWRHSCPLTPAAGLGMVPRLGMELMAPALEAWCCNHWTSGEVPQWKIKVVKSEKVNKEFNLKEYMIHF